MYLGMLDDVVIAMCFFLGRGIIDLLRIKTYFRSTKSRST